MGKRGQAIRLILGFWMMLWAGAALAAGPGQCRDDQVLVRGDFGQARFSVEVAETRADRNRGLMFRKSMPKSAGMLFVYEAPGTRNFWMKNTFIPLDILFLDQTGTVRSIKHQAEPHNVSPIFGGHDIQYVLEINGGLARAMGIAEGAELQHPAFGAQTAAWPC